MTAQGGADSGETGAVDPRPDAVLVAAANDGDRGAFEVIYQRYQGWVARLAYRFTQDQQGAADVTQETFIYLLRKFPGFELHARLTTVLYPVVRHLARDWRKKRFRGHASLEGVDAWPATAEPFGAAERDELDHVLASLSEMHREVLLMRYIDAMSVDEIAAALQVPAGTVKSRLHHALSRARAAMLSPEEKKLRSE